MRMLSLKSILVLCVVALIASCAGPRQYAAKPKRRLPLTAEQYLAIANLKAAPEKQAYTLLAAERYIQDHQSEEALEVLNQLNTRSLPPAIETKKNLLEASLYLKNSQPQRAIAQLTALSDDKIALSPSNQIAYYKLAASAYAQANNPLSSLQAQITLSRLLRANERKEMLASIWQTLQKLPPLQLKQLLENSPPAELAAWYALTLITDEYATDPATLAQKLMAWQREYPTHPANALLPKRLKSPNVTAQHPTKIALLLPRKGPYQAQADAIRNGFFAAYYAKRPPISIKLYDTSEGDITRIYQTALKEGAQMVVGPLTKNHIAELINGQRLSVPTLALNTLPLEYNIRNLYQFSLSPEDEAMQAAKRMQDDARHRVALIAPDSGWGKRIASRFEKEWIAQGGVITARLNYKDQGSLANGIRDLLHVDQAAAEKSSLQKILHQKLRYVGRRRQDIDAFFIVAKPDIARQIRPMLKYYYAGDVPVYATSMIFPGFANPGRDHDLNGILFCGTPWTLTPNALQSTHLNQIRAHIEKIWPHSFHQYPNLYALGIDAFQMIPRLNKMAMLPDIGTNGASGLLYLTRDRRIHRHLLWAQMKNGKPTLR